MTTVRLTATLTGDDQYTASTQLIGDMSLSISGTFTGTVTVQRSFDLGATWRDVDTFTRPTEEVGFEPALLTYRVGVKSGSPWSGSAVVQLQGHDRWRYE